VVKVAAGSDEATMKAAALADAKVAGADGRQDGGEGDRGAGQACESCGEVGGDELKRKDKAERTDADERPVRGTQSFVHTLSACWRRPSLTALEVLWRWVYGAPALALMGYEAMRVCAAQTPVDVGALGG
jgi:hypothetical protein